MIKKIEAEIERLTAELEAINTDDLDLGIEVLEQEVGKLAVQRSNMITEQKRLQNEIEFFEKAKYKLGELEEEIE